MTVPSRLAVAETLRLQADLSVPVRAIVLNQVPPSQCACWAVLGKAEANVYLNGILASLARLIFIDKQLSFSVCVLVD